MNKTFRLFAILAIVGMAFAGCQKEDNVVPKKDNLVETDKLSFDGMVEYTDLFDAPSGHRLKASMMYNTIYYKNFITGHIRPYRIAYDRIHKQIWLAENFKETQFFAYKSLRNPNDPDGSNYGYFYFYEDIEVEPQVVLDMFGEEVRQWGFYRDSLCSKLIDVEWRIPTLSDINKLVEYLGDIQRAYSPTYGIDMRYTGWCYRKSDGSYIWQTAISDCIIWLQDEDNHSSNYYNT